jgi:transcriptional regulator with XRE-family HTH domain
MPLNSEGLPTNSRQEFCLALKTARERKGITLAEIAAATKIPSFMFAALERSDLSRWPKGLFRRSFFRDYARTIGLPVAEACAEFIRLFPDDESAARAKVSATAEVEEEDADVRLKLDSAWHGPRAVLARLLAAPIDAGAVILVAFALARVAGLDRSAVTAIVALAYFSLATMLIGESPAKWAIARRQAIFDAVKRGPLAGAAAWRHAADAIAHVFPRAEGDTAEPEAEPEVRTWITDARRVGPAPPSRLRVRFKVSQ